MEEHQPLRQEADEKSAQWLNWVAQTDSLVAEMLARREGQPIPVDDLLKADRAELEKRVFNEI